MKKIIIIVCLTIVSLTAQAQLQTSAGVQYLQCMPKDVSTDFYDLSNTYFLADSLDSFNTQQGIGMVQWKRYRLSPRQAFNLNGYWPVRMQMLDFPDTQYDNDPNLALKIDFVSPRCVRIRMATSPIEAARKDSESLMLAGAVPVSKDWKALSDGKTIAYKTAYGCIEIQRYPFRLVLKDAKGKVLTQTRHIIDNDSTQVKLLPFNFIKRGSDNSRSVNPVFLLSPGERIYGCGESFTSLNKVGQKVHLSVTDPQGPETDGMYKPVPFYFSNRGYGIFMHTSAPVTADFGSSYIGAQRLFMADEQVDLFVFFGEPKDILNEYTDITGKSPMLPLWSFGTWMSRITYFSQEEGLILPANYVSTRFRRTLSISTRDGSVLTGSVTTNLPKTVSQTPWVCCVNWQKTVSIPACGSCPTSHRRTAFSTRLSETISTSEMPMAVCRTRMPYSTSRIRRPSHGISRRLRG